MKTKRSLLSILVFILLAGCNPNSSKPNIITLKMQYMPGKRLFSVPMRALTSLKRISGGSTKPLMHVASLIQPGQNAMVLPWPAFLELRLVRSNLSIP